MEQPQLRGQALPCRGRRIVFRVRSIQEAPVEAALLGAAVAVEVSEFLWYRLLLEIGSKLSALDQPRPCPRLLWQATQATLCSSLDGSGARAVAGPQSTKPVGTVKAVFIISLGPAVLFWIYFNKSGRPASSGLAAGLPFCFRSQS